MTLAALPLCAGVRIQMENTDLGTQKTTRQEMLLDSNRFRINVDGNTSMMFLTDGGRNRMVMLDKSKNEYTEIDQQMLNQMAQQMQGAMAQLEQQLKNLPPDQRALVEKMMKGKMPQPAAPVTTLYTAKGSGAVNGFACTQYEGTRSGQKVAEVCAAQPAQLKYTAADFQVFDKMKEFVSGLQSSFQNSPFAAGFTGIGERGLEGFPVQTISFSNGQPSQKNELKSADRATFTDADFSTGNAKKVEMPTGRGAAR